MFDWDVLRANRAREISRLNGIYNQLLANAGVTIITGWATLVDGHHVKVEEQTFSAKTS